MSLEQPATEASSARETSPTVIEGSDFKTNEISETKAVFEGVEAGVGKLPPKNIEITVAGKSEEEYVVELKRKLIDQLGEEEGGVVFNAYLSQKKAAIEDEAFFQ